MCKSTGKPFESLIQEDNPETLRPLLYSYKFGSRTQRPVLFGEVYMRLRIALAAAALFAALSPASAQLSLFTFLNNSPDPAYATADLYVTQAGIVSKVEDIPFQGANNLNSVAVFGDIDVTFAVAPGNSIDASEAKVEYTFVPGADKGYMVMVHGVSNATGYVANPDAKPITLKITSFEVAPYTADPNKTGVYFVHGVSDMETGDFWFRGGSKVAAAGMGYTSNAAAVAATDRKAVTVDFTKAGDKSKALASFSVDFGTLASSVVVCVTSGFKTPSENGSGKDTMALLSVLEDGRVVRSPLLAGSQTSRIQLVHNAADPLATVVDVYLNGTKAFDNVSFRKATPFSNVPANTPLIIGIAPATSTAYKDTIGTITLDPLRPGRTYSLIATGVIDSTKFRRNPNGKAINLQIAVLEGALEASSESGKSAVRTAHFATDAPRVTIASSSTTYASNVTYGDAAAAYTLVAPAIDTLWVSGEDGKRIRGYVCDLRGQNKAFLALASGFFVPDSNQTGPAFKLILVEPNGSVNATLQEVDPGTTSVEELLDASSTWTVGPVPARELLRIEIPVVGATVHAYELISITGQVVARGEFAGDAGSARASIDVSGMPSGTYTLRALNIDATPIGVRPIVIQR